MCVSISIDPSFFHDWLQIVVESHGTGTFYVHTKILFGEGFVLPQIVTVDQKAPILLNILNPALNPTILSFFATILHSDRIPVGQKTEKNG